ncbi:chromosome segregation ATPase [Aeromonas veronii]|uniref:DNA-binding protein n=1 Tax=Aeromonas TaxID=642 RepID=UPI001C5B573D|nr:MULTISPECIES: DNA-binding protein [Aeromonas]MBW3762732.1 chromosome segregation ATPase [Aeromonas jandaei]MBW3779058.1 chromosome segregation ATPase [Aeromonas veronii]
MARKLVEYADVAKAAQALKDAGKKPTITSIRELLDSKGSYTTISTYLKRWAEENALEQSPPEIELPQAIINDGNIFLKRLYLAAQTETNERLQHERELMYRKEQELKDELEQAIEMANNDAERADLFEEQLETLKSQMAETNTALTQSDKALSLKAAELEHALADLNRLHKRFAELEDNLDEKSQSLIRAQNQLEQTEIEKRSLSQKLVDTEGELTVQKSKNIEHAEKLRAAYEQGDVLKAQLDTLHSRLADLQGELATVKAQWNASENERNKLEIKLSDAQEEIRGLLQSSGVMAGQLQERDSHSKSLEAKISKLEQELAEANRPLHIEEGANKKGD